MKIVTYTKGGVANMSLDPKKDAVISIVDPRNKHPEITEGVPVLRLCFDDINDETLSKTQLFLANRIKTEKQLELYNKFFTGTWPCVPFTPFHADKVIECSRFLSRGYEKNWHVHCEYGRSRSVAIAMFLHFIFPKHEIVLQRDNARPNTRVYRLLTKMYGVA